MMKYLLPFVWCFLFACGNKKDKPDVSHLEVKLKLERFEPAFFSLDTNNTAQGLGKLRNAYPYFFPTFMQNILQLNPVDPQSIDITRHILASYRSLYDSLQPKYRDLGWLQKELTQGFQYVQYYYPQYRVPAIITFIGTLDAPGVVLTNEYLAIGLQQFAGKNFGGYQLPEVQQLYPTYISRRFDQEYIAANAMKAVVDDIYPDRSAGKPLVEQMIEKGKQWYLLDHLLPDAPDSVKTGYSGKQLSWIQANEGDVWGYIVKNENIYAIDPPVIQTYIGEAPFTQGMPESSPGNIGQWLGWRMVQLFAQKHPELTLQQVLETAPRAVFEGAKYKPK